MSFLNELINSENDQFLREELQERVEIVAHKIKFMDKVPVICLDTKNLPNLLLANEINAAGGILETDVLAAVYVVYYQPGKGLNELMREIPTLLQQDWPAVKNGRIILLDGQCQSERDAAAVVSLVENFAEMFHPGSFVFGAEGEKWIRFGV